MDCDVRASSSFRSGSVRSGQTLVEGESGGVVIFGFARVVQGTVGEEGFAGTFQENNSFVAEELVDYFSFFHGDEEKFAFAVAPDGQEILRGEEDGRRVGEGSAEEHGGGAAVDEIDLSAEVEGDRRPVGLVAIKEHFSIGGDGVVGFELLDSVGEAARREHGGKACEGDVSWDEESGRGKGDSYSRSEMPALRAEKPGDGRASEEGYGGERGGET